MNLNRWKVWSCVAGVLLLLALVTPSRTDLGWAYLSRREYAQARETFVEQLRHDPSDPQTWLGLAAVYDALGDPERQIVDCGRGRKGRPRSAGARARAMGAPASPLRASSPPRSATASRSRSAAWAPPPP